MKKLKKATKFDGSKVMLELIPPELELAAGRAFTYGAKKYAPGNYAKGMEWSRLLGAIKRHLSAWASGEVSDPESKLCHLDHVAATVGMLIAHVERNIGTDDRISVGIKKKK